MYKETWCSVLWSSCLDNHCFPYEWLHNWNHLLLFKGTVLRDRLRKSWRKLTDLGLNKGHGWFLNFSEAPLNKQLTIMKPTQTSINRNKWTIKSFRAPKKFKHQPRPLVRSSSLKFGQNFWNLSHETVPLNLFIKSYHASIDN